MLFAAPASLAAMSPSASLPCPTSPLFQQRKLISSWEMHPNFGGMILRGKGAVVCEKIQYFPHNSALGSSETLNYNTVLSLLPMNFLVKLRILTSQKILALFIWQSNCKKILVQPPVGGDLHRSWDVLGPPKLFYSALLVGAISCLNHPTKGILMQSEQRNASPLLHLWCTV